MKFFPILGVVLATLSSSYAHLADPNYLLAKYSLYGKDGISSAPNVVTDTSGKGWIGTDQNFGGSNSTTTYGPLKIGGNFSAASGTYYGSIDVIGNINSGSTTFGNLANGPDTVRYNGTYGGGHAGGAISEFGTASIETPNFPTYNVLSDDSKNCTLSPTGWINGTGGGCPITGSSATTPLPPGSYGDINIQAGVKGIFVAGLYELKSLYINDSLLVDKKKSEMTRILIKEDFTLKSTNTGAIVTKEALDYGRVLLYVTGTTVETQAGQTFMASIIAPNANVAVNPNMKIYGQVLAKFINLSNGFDASLGEFVPFQPVGITIAGADTLKFYEDPTGSPDNIFTENSRIIEVPIVLQTALENNVSVQFKIIKSPLSPPADSGNGRDFTANSSDQAGILSSGTLNFTKGQNSPDTTPSFYLYDDGVYENDEYIRVILYNASPSDSVEVEGQDSSGLGVFDIPIVSDDPLNRVPDSLVFSADSFPENQSIGFFVGLLKTFDADTGQVHTYNFVESSTYASNTKFQIRSDSLFTAQLFDYESDPHFDTLKVRATDPLTGYTQKVIYLSLTNLNDENPIGFDDTIKVNEDATQTQLSNGNLSVLNNDTDPDNTVTTSSHSVTLLGSSSLGNLNLNTNGTFSYKHTQSEKFSDSVFYEIDDGIQKDTAKIIIIVTPINDYSPVGVSDSILLNEGDSSSVLKSGSLNLVFNDTDADSLVGDSIWIESLIDSSTHGRFEWTDQGTFTYYSNASSEVFQDSVYYIITDGLFKDSVKLHININPMNDESPQGYNNSLELNEGSSRQTTFLGDTSLIQRASDLDSLVGNQFWVSTILDTTSFGSVTLDSLGAFSYSHDNSENFKDSFSYEITDGLWNDTAWVYININAINDLKIEGINDTITLDEGSSVSVNLLTNDSLNLEIGDTLKLDSILVNTQHGSVTFDSIGTLNYQHDSTESFKDSLSYVVSDGIFKDTLWLIININPINDESPTRIDTVANINTLEDFNDTLKLSWIGLFEDLDSLIGDTLSYSVNVLSGLNLVTYQSLATSMSISSQSDSNGVVLFELIASDGKFQAKDTFEINITAVNDAPYLDSSSNVVINEDTGSVTITNWIGSASVGPANESSQTVLDLQIINQSNSTLFSVAPFLDSIGQLQFTTAQDSFGIDSIQVKIRDNGDTLNQGVDSTLTWFVIEILPINDAPSYSATQTVFNLKEDDPKVVLALWADSISQGPSNESSQVLSFESINTGSTLFSEEPNVDNLGTLSYQLAADANGKDTVWVRIKDDGGTLRGGVDSSNYIALYFDVVAINDLPTLESQVYIINENIANQSHLDSVWLKDSLSNFVVDSLGNTQLISVSDTRFTLGYDVDGDIITYKLVEGLDDTLFTLDSVSGNLYTTNWSPDFETDSSYSILISAISLNDTIVDTLEVRIRNIIEYSSISAVAAIHTDSTITAPDTVWTHRDSASVIWLRDSSLVDTLSYALKSESINSILGIQNTASKDFADTAEVVFIVNTRDPQIKSNLESERVYNDTIYTNQALDSLNFWVEYVDKDLKTQSLDTIVTSNLTEGSNWVIISYTDVYGNTGIDSFVVVLDTTAPVVVIHTPQDSSIFEQYTIDSVQWSVDANMQDSLNTALIPSDSAYTWIIRSFTDRAGNTGSDSVIVFLNLKQNEITVRVDMGVVESGTKLNQVMQEYYENKGREPLENEIVNVTIINRSGDQAIEVYTGNKSTQNTNSELEQENTSPELINYDAEFYEQLDEAIPSITLGLHFPQNGGEDSQGNPREGSCDDGLPMWELGIKDASIHVFDHLGQFILLHKIPGVSFANMEATDIQKDDASVEMRMDLPAYEGKMRSLDGRELGAGIYLGLMRVQSYANPINCNTEPAQNYKRETRFRFGYRRGE